MNMKIIYYAMGLLLGSQLSACQDTKYHSAVVSQQPQGVASTVHKADKIWPKLNIEVKRDPKIEAAVNALLAKMTIEQKVAQTIQPEIRDFTVADMRKYGFGSYLNGGGSFPHGNKHATPEQWVDLAEQMYQASVDASEDGINIPTMWGTDAVHGHNNVIGATLFPHNIGLGAMHDPKLMRKIAHATAEEVLATGIDWIFAPTVAVVRDDRWGRTYEGYSEDPQIVRQYSYQFVLGLQGKYGKDFLNDHHVISTVKHFLGDGGTENGDDQGNNLATEQQLFDIHAQGYVGGLTAGAQSVMASFNSWHGVKNHGNKYLLTDVLKTRMGFDGFVVGDWNGHGQVPGCTNESCSKAFNAGLDIFMVPTAAWKPLYFNTIAQVKSGEISEQRLNDAVRRILRVKMRAGLFTKPSPKHRPLSGHNNIIGSAEHRAIARQAVRESLVLLKNKQHILPLSPTQHILVTGSGANNIGQQAGGWSITWQGTGNTNADFPGATSIYQGLANAVNQAGGHIELAEDGKFTHHPDVAIVVFGEQPYAEGNGDLDNLEYQRGNKTNLALLTKLKAQHIPVVSVFLTGRPLWVNPELNASDAFVVAWLPGTEGEGVADVILATKTGTINHDFTGKLSYSWPATPEQTHVNRFDKAYHPLFAYGFGLTYQDKDTLTDNLSIVRNEQQHSLTSLKLFSRIAMPPWQLLIADQDKQTAITSNMVSNKVMNLRTVDKKLQEDARQITWNGTGSGTVLLQSNFPSDLRAYSEAASTLTFDIKVIKASTEPITLSMQCDPSCPSSVNISPTLAKLPLNQWQQISIDLTCFSQNDGSFGRVTRPFLLTSKQSTSLAFANILIAPHTAKTSTIHCSAP